MFTRIQSHFEAVDHNVHSVWNCQETCVAVVLYLHKTSVIGIRYTSEDAYHDNGTNGSTGEQGINKVDIWNCTICVTFLNDYWYNRWQSWRGTSNIKKMFYEHNNVQYAKPLMLTYCAAGLVFRVDFGRAGIRKCVTFSHFYSLVAMILLAFGFLYDPMIFRSDAKLDISFLIEIAMSVYNIESFAHFVGFYVASWKKLPEFFIQWEKVQSVYSSPLTSIKRQVYIATAVLWIVMIIFTVASAYFLFETPLQDLMLIPSKTDDLRADIIKVVKVVFSSLRLVSAFNLNVHGYQGIVPRIQWVDQTRKNNRG